MAREGKAFRGSLSAVRYGATQSALERIIRGDMPDDPTKRKPITGRNPAPPHRQLRDGNMVSRVPVNSATKWGFPTCHLLA